MEILEPHSTSLLSEHNLISLLGPTKSHLSHHLCSYFSKSFTLNLLLVSLFFHSQFYMIILVKSGVSHENLIDFYQFFKTAIVVRN